MKETSKINKLLQYIAILGNVIYIFWILYNGIDEGFQGGPVAIVSFIGLFCLLILNIFLIHNKNNMQN
jgi:uncharacterized membrane protein